jgi:hypothetical protein
VSDILGGAGGQIKQLADQAKQLGDQLGGLFTFLLSAVNASALFLK